MKRIKLLWIAAALLVLCMCGRAQALDPAKLAEDLIGGVPFAEALTPLETENAQRLYRIDSKDMLQVVAYVGTGATVDEFSIWESSGSSAAKRIQESLQSRIDEQKEGYSDYMPEEVPKLDHAVLIQQGDWVILCVSEDAEIAKEIIRKGFAS
ncbi:MAG: DUF4358 domain-containing protein [Peptococcaceae bacterium]|jgi:hypothetical protein|nr:DUF4358 domain-containing protein [Peptococcaceae bacterium]